MTIFQCHQKLYQYAMPLELIAAYAVFAFSRGRHAGDRTIFLLLASGIRAGLSPDPCSSSSHQPRFATLLGLIGAGSVRCSVHFPQAQIALKLLGGNPPARPPPPPPGYFSLARLEDRRGRALPAPMTPVRLIGFLDRCGVSNMSIRRPG